MSALWPHQSLGSPRSPAVVFLHGFLGRGRDWLPIAEGLAQHFRCILPDLPGHGAQPSLEPSGRLDFTWTNSGLQHLLNALRIENPILVGYSLGGRVALNFACSGSRPLRALVLESTSPGIASETERRARARLDDVRAVQIREQGLEVFVEAWYQAGLWDSLRAQPELLAHVKTSRKRQDPVRMARVITDLSPGRMPPLWDCLPGLRMPVLLAAGALDAKYARLAPQAAAAIPGARLALFPNAGHNIHLEDPDGFSRQLQGFIVETQHAASLPPQ